MNRPKHLLLGCAAVHLSALGLLAAASDPEKALIHPLNNFTFASVGYQYRLYGGGHDGDGSSQAVSLAYSKEWNLQRERKQVSLQLMPSVSMAIADYDRRPASAHTVEIGSRIGVLAHSKDRKVSLGLFTDVHGSFDSIQDRPRQLAVMVRPGFQATIRVREPLALQFEYRYHGLAAHEITDTDSLEHPTGGTGARIDLHRIENSLEHEFRNGIAWAPFIHRKSWAKDMVVQAGALTYGSFSPQAPQRTALGAYLNLRQAF